MQNIKISRQSNKVLVVGGGLGGIRTAFDLAEMKKDVVLVDRAAAIGGLAAYFDRTFPTNSCDLCIISPHLSETARQGHIDLILLSRVESVKGEKGDFVVTLRTEPRYISLDKCTGCGECLKHFPQCVNFNPGLDHRAPACLRHPRATPQSFSIDLKKCHDVKALVDICPAGAINPAERTHKRQIHCAAIVLSPGASLFDPSHLDYFGYGKLPDVVTSLEYERILSASGPTGGKLLRPSNGERPRKVAWIQCVGSRGMQKGAGAYCSHACCMFALKEAILTRERYQKDIETTIFYIDLRTFGKGYELYLDRAKNDCGVRLLRCRPHSILQPAGRTDLTVLYTTDESSKQHEEHFDMIVLSTGFKTSDDTRKLLAKMGIARNSDFFPETDGFNPVVTSRPGIYVAGTFAGPKDIAETMVQASAAACLAGADVRPAAQGAEEADELKERDISLAEPRVGIFICACTGNADSTLDVASLVDHAATLPHVAVARTEGHGCSRVSMDNIRRTIEEEQLNRVVIGGCSSRNHKIIFEKLLRRAGLNKHMIEVADIRDQASGVHAAKPSEASARAKAILGMAVGEVVNAQPLATRRLPMNKNVLVVGGGVAGMSAAIRLADQEFQVYLVEKSDRLGGVANELFKTLEGDDVQTFIGDLIRKVRHHHHIHVFTQALIVDHFGSVGMFRTGLQRGPQLFYHQLEHGVTILATGANPNRPALYLLDEHPAVRTQLETLKYIVEHPKAVKKWDNVVMIQCVGSRTADNPGCSRICCQNAVKNALAILAVNPEARIFVLYRDMRTYGFQEEYYRQAREKGVIFVRYQPDIPPVLQAAGDQVEVSFIDPLLGRRVTVIADGVSLSTGMVSDIESTEELSRLFKLPRTADGYFMEDDVKLRPVDMPVPGFFMAGTAHSPQLIRESISQANAVAARAQTILVKDEIDL